MNSELNLLAINLTRRCNLACAHCYLDATTRDRADASELKTEEVCALLDKVAQRSEGSMVVLTGGEPLLRKDIEAITRHGHNLGLFMVLGTNGMLLSEKRVASLKQAGLAGAGISLDSLDQERHDRFRNQPGAWRKTMAGIEACRRQMLSIQLHFSVTSDNAEELADMVAFSDRLGVRVLNIFFLVCTGRGEKVTDISAQQYERLLHLIVQMQQAYPALMIRPRCAPHFKRIAMQVNPQATINRIAGTEGDGCIAGRHYCRITPHGHITACPYIEQPVGNIRTGDFWHYWDCAEMFNQLRSPTLSGKCGQCEYRQLCGGCRARPVAQGKGLMDDDTLCLYQPVGGNHVQPLDVVDTPLLWSAEARQRLQRIPSFIRKMVKKRAEAYVSDLGETEILTSHLDQMIANRFGGKRPTFFASANQQLPAKSVAGDQGSGRGK